MKKKIITLAAIFAIGAPTLAACGASSDAPGTTAATTTSPAESTTAESAATTGTTTTADASSTEAATSTAASDVQPYAWLGLQDMPKCNYLDILSTGKYIKTVDYSAMGITVEQTEAQDGANTFKKNPSTVSYSVDGKVLSINEASKIYMEYDMESLAETAKETYEAAMKDGTNIIGRAFVEKNKGTIPGSDDTTEYEYYEYNYPEAEELGTSTTERFYMKDGDVYAVWQKVKLGESEVESVETIKSISGDIPAGTFDLPDLSGYQKYE